MKTMAITDFKAHALQVLGEVAKTKEPVDGHKLVANLWPKSFRLQRKSPHQASLPRHWCSKMTL